MKWADAVTAFRAGTCVEAYIEAPIGWPSKTLHVRYHWPRDQDHVWRVEESKAEWHPIHGCGCAANMPPHFAELEELEKRLTQGAISVELLHSLTAKINSVGMALLASDLRQAVEVIKWARSKGNE